MKKRDDRIFGLRFTYESGDYLEDAWINNSRSEWVTHDIPEGYQIAGMFVNFDIKKEQFGFNLRPVNSDYWP